MGRGKKDGVAATKNWGAKDHSSRLDAKLDNLSKTCKRKGLDINEQLSNGYKRSRFAHDSRDKWEADKLRLTITKTKREVEKLKERLIGWDDVDEGIRLKKEMELEKKKRMEEENERNGIKKKKRGRLGPETWKLRGAARPAHEVYDFDTRYVDPHLKAHEEARAKARRSRNILSLYKGQFCPEDLGKESEHLQSICRQYLSLMMQLALLYLEGKKLKTGRETLLEIIELEGTDHDMPPTNARSHLMRMYLDKNRPDSARKLWDRLPSDTSVWIRYSAALIEFVSWKILEEEGSNQQTAEMLLAKAIQGNMFCAFYIAFHDTFQEVMEYTDEVEDTENGTIEQAIEYCNSEQMGSWLGTDDAVEWIRTILLRCIHGGEIAQGKLGNIQINWDKELTKIEKEQEEKENDGDSDDGEDEEIDVLMYAGMFRTAMDMLQDAGVFVKDSNLQNSKFIDKDEIITSNEENVETEESSADSENCDS